MDHKLQVIQSNLYITTLYIAVTLYILVTGKLPKIFSGLIFFTKLTSISHKSPGIITVTLPFPKGDCCTQVWLYIVHVITQCKLTSNMLDWCTLASVKPGLSYIIYIKIWCIYTVYRQALWHLNNARLSEKSLGASWPPSFHFLSPEQVF